MAYVYKLRGTERYESLSEYLRKGWPIFTPFNVLLYMFTRKRASKPIMDLNDFKELDPIRENWETIRDEAIQLYKSKAFELTKKPGSAASYDIGFRTFFKYGWSKYYLNWYGYTHESAKRSCPKTLEILKSIPSVNGALFSLLPAGSQLTRHLDPAACSLRYHLGLATPNSDKAFINVDGKSHSWRDGKGFLFDETYIHYAKNNSDDFRLILMCEVERPMYLISGVINFFYKILIRLTVVPNTEEDKRGLSNTIFGGLSPMLQKS